MSNVKVTRACTVTGCKGTMYFHDRREPADGPNTLEWPWYATWVCAENPALFQLVTDAEYREDRSDPCRSSAPTSAVGLRKSFRQWSRPMNNAEARDVLARELTPYRDWPYEQLCAIVDAPKRAFEV